MAGERTPQSESVAFDTKPYWGEVEPDGALVRHAEATMLEHVGAERWHPWPKCIRIHTEVLISCAPL